MRRDLLIVERRQTPPDSGNSLCTHHLTRGTSRSAANGLRLVAGAKVIAAFDSGVTPMVEWRQETPHD
jgi:hypothetical protein